MTGFEFFLHVLWQIVWPFKGIIYMEEQALQWIIAFGHSWLDLYGYILLICFGIVLALASVRILPKIRYGRIFSRILNSVLVLVARILFAWVLLIYGALASDENGNRGERNAQARFRVLFHTITYTSWHFRLGRLLYRFFYWVLGYIPIVQRNVRIRRILSRVCAMIIILWGVWNIPYDLTH